MFVFVINQVFFSCVTGILILYFTESVLKYVTRNQISSVLFSEFCRNKSQSLSLGMLRSVLVMWVLLLQTPRRRWVSCLFVAVLYESNMIPICSGFDWIGGKQNFKRIRIFSPGLLRRDGFHSSHSINEPIASCWQLLGYGARLLNEVVPNCCLGTLS